MKLESKYFDRIRIKPDGETTVTEAPACEWQGCAASGGYRAPKGRMREGQYFNFCLDHVRAYNKSYNYFAGMGDDDIAAYQRSSATGHRPTWQMGVNSWGEKRGEANSARVHAWDGAAAHDPFGLFGDRFAQQQRRPEPAADTRRPVRSLERQSFAILDLEGEETGPEIKARYKMLVKRFHPDANGGDRSFEDRLREIIKAYNHLKAAGYC
jgi:curved DNA-binding protein CbpA